MTWILALGLRPATRAMVQSLRAECPDLQEVDAPDRTGTSGVVVCDAPSRELLQVLATAAAVGSHVIVLSGSARAFDPWSLLEAGASDMVIWDDDPRPIRARLGRVHEIERLVDSDLVTDVIIGRSPALRRVLRELVTAARFGTGPILILGETGTGKELAARVAHSVSEGGRSGNLVVVDCTTIVPTLSGSELFGHERGAFTGAVSVRTGACAAANGGTLMLDEVGELPLDLQPELLRVVQEGTYKRVGADTWLRSRFRLVCATNRDLEQEVVEGRFRADFYYRIAACIVTLPPLAQRPDDLVPLFQFFFAQASGSPDAVQLCPAVTQALHERAYPGNLRDLRQLAVRVAARHVGPGPITPGDLPPADRPARCGSNEFTAADREPMLVPTEWIQERLGEGVTLKQMREQVTEAAVTAALDQTGGNVRAAAGSARRH